MSRVMLVKGTAKSHFKIKTIGKERKCYTIVYFIERYDRVTNFQYFLLDRVSIA